MPKPTPEVKPWCDYGDPPQNVHHDFVVSTTGVRDQDSTSDETDAVVVTFCTRCGTVGEVRSHTLT